MVAVSTTKRDVRPDITMQNCLRWGENRPRNSGTDTVMSISLRFSVRTCNGPTLPEKSPSPGGTSLSSGTTDYANAITAYSPAVFSFVGWMLIGLPVVLLFPARSIARLSWPLRLMLGAALGPLALLVIFVLLGRGHMDARAGFRGTGFLWCYSIVVSTVSFLVYAALLNREGAA